MWPTKFSTSTIIVLVLLIALAAPIAVIASNQTSIRRLMIHEVVPANELSLRQDPVSVVTKFNAALKTNDANGALSFFTDDAVLKMLPEDAPGGIIAVGKTRIGLWLQEIMHGQGGLEVQLLSDYKVAGKNVTWAEAIWFESYYSDAHIAYPLPASAEAVVAGDKISSFTLTLTPESVAKLTRAAGSSPENRGALSLATSGFVYGLSVLGLIFPTAAIYYISRVKSLFAAVPRLERPWLLLLAGVASLLLAVLLIFLKGSASIPSWDLIYSVVLVLTAFFILASMVLMKRVWTLPGSE